MRRNHSLRWRHLLAAGIALSALAATPVKDRTIPLAYTPQGSEEETTPTVSASMVTKPVRLVFEDGRPSKEQAAAGEGTTDRDLVFAWLPTSPVPEFAKDTFIRIAQGWGIRLEDKAPLSLHVRLLRFYVTEKNQAVGSTYLAEVRVAFELHGPDDGLLSAGVVAGEANRYGKKQSPANCNEVLSDAARAAYFRLIGHKELQAAWGGGTVDAPSASAQSAKGGS